MGDKIEPGGRINFRAEGDLWCAYYVGPNIKDGTLFLASIHLAFVQNLEIKNRFMQIIQDVVRSVFTASGHKIEYSNYTASPDHERGGNA